jgi:hypothetical protein
MQMVRGNAVLAPCGRILRNNGFGSVGGTRFQGRNYSFDRFRVSNLLKSATGSSNTATETKDLEEGLSDDQKVKLAAAAKPFDDRGHLRAEDKDDTRPRVLVIGSGWGGFNFVKDIDKKKYRVTMISPSNHFLVSTCCYVCALDQVSCQLLRRITFMNNIPSYKCRIIATTRIAH